MAKRKGARHAHSVDSLSEMDGFERELLRATNEHTASVLWGLAGICLVLLAVSFSLPGLGVTGLASGTVSAVLLGAVVFFVLLSLAPLRKIRKIDNKELEGAEEFFNAIRDNGSLLPH